MTSILQNEREEVQLKQRVITVVEVKDISKTLRRVTFHGEDLEGFKFHLLSPEAHVKLFFPDMETGELRMPTVPADGWGADWEGVNEGRFSPFRDYTIRSFDADALIVEIDFALHHVGVGGPWAIQAKAGQKLGIFGPRFIKTPPLNAKRYVFLADETSLPALARWLEILPEEAIVDAWIEVESVESEIILPSHAGAHVHWLYSKPDETIGSKLIEAVELISDEFFSSETWVWAATEAHTIAKLKRTLVKDERLNSAHLDLTSYWKQV